MINHANISEEQGINNVSTALVGSIPPYYPVSSFKRCSKCKEIKFIDEFYKDKTKKDGYKSQCKECNKEKRKIWCKSNRDKLRKSCHDYHKRHPEKARDRQNRWRKLNHKRGLELGYKWKKHNPEKVCEIARNGDKKRRHTPKGNLNHRMSCQIWHSLHRNKEGQNWKDMVDYSLNDLKKHLEKQFSEGMTWEKFLKGEIHIDHKIPISVFNFTKPDHLDFQRCWALGNLQPLWAHDNLVKQAKIDKPFQLGLAI